MALKRALKKDLSKEAMYRKIMPSIAAHIDGIQDTEPQQEPGLELLNIALPCNIMEIIVRKKLLQTMERLGACRCDQCRKDAIALTLNDLPPVYVTDRSKILGKIHLVRKNYEVKITSALIRSIQSVMKNPRH